MLEKNIPPKNCHSAAASFPTFPILPEAEGSRIWSIFSKKGSRVAPDKDLERKQTLRATQYTICLQLNSQLLRSQPNYNISHVVMLRRMH